MSITNTNTAFQETNLQNISNNTNDTSVNLQATTGLDAQNVNSRNSLNNIDSTSISRTVQQQQIAQMAIAHIVRDIDKCEAEIAAIKSPKGLQKFINVLQTIFNLIDSTIKTPTQRIAELRANVQNKLQQLNEYNVIWQSCYISQSASQSSGTSPIQTQDTNSEVQADEVTPNAEEAQSLAQQAVQDTRELHQKNLPEPFLREANKQTLTLIFGKLDEKASAFTDASTSINEPHQRQAAMVGDTGVPPPPPPPPPPPGAVGSATVSSNGASTNSANASNAHNALEENFDNDLKAFQELQSKGKTVEFSFSYRGLQGNEVARKLASRSIHNKGELTAYQQDLSKSVDRLNGEIDSLKKPIDELKNKIQAAINDCLSNTTTVKQVVCGKSIDCTLSLDEGQKNLYGSNPLAFFNDLELLKMQGLINDTQYQTLSDLRDQKLTNGTQTDFQNRLDSIKSINDAIAQLKNESNASATLLPKCKTGMDQQIAELVEQQSKLPDELKYYWLDFSYNSLQSEISNIIRDNESKIKDINNQIDQLKGKLKNAQTEFEKMQNSFKSELADKIAADYKDSFDAYIKNPINTGTGEPTDKTSLQITHLFNQHPKLKELKLIAPEILQKNIKNLQAQKEKLENVDITQLLKSKTAQMSVENLLVSLKDENIEVLQNTITWMNSHAQFQGMQGKFMLDPVINPKEFSANSAILNKLAQKIGCSELGINGQFRENLRQLSGWVNLLNELKKQPDASSFIHDTTQKGMSSIDIKKNDGTAQIQNSLTSYLYNQYAPVKSSKISIPKRAPSNTQPSQNNQQISGNQQVKLRSISNPEEQKTIRTLTEKVVPLIKNFGQSTGINTSLWSLGYARAENHNSKHSYSYQDYVDSIKENQKQPDETNIEFFVFANGQKFTEDFGIRFCTRTEDGQFTYTDAYLTALLYGQSLQSNEDIARQISNTDTAKTFIDALSKENADQQASASAQNQGNNVSA